MVTEPIQISLSDMLFGFVQLTREKWPQATFPISSSLVWHRFFYDLKRFLSPRFPELEKAIGPIEWDEPSPYIPHIPKLADLLNETKKIMYFRTDEHGRMYPIRIKPNSLSTSLFEEMLRIARTHEGMLKNAT